jgi:glycosyltransferase involved in cell wall biosynthesis
MRFLILTQYFPPEIGAAQIRLAAVAKTLIAQGHEVEIVTALPNYPTGKIFPEFQGKFYQHEQWQGMSIHRVWTYAAMGAGMKRLLNYFSFVFTAFYGLAKAQKPDYIFVESPPLFLSLTAWVASRWWGVPFIFNVADVWPDSIKALSLMDDGLFLRLAGKLELWSYRRAAFINAVTYGNKDTFLQRKNVPENKILFLPNGIDTELFYPRKADAAWRAELGLDARPLIVYAGTQGYAHGIDVALHAAKILQDKQVSVQFVFVGGGSEKPRLQALTQELALNNVQFWQPRPNKEIAELYALAIAGLSTLADTPAFDDIRPVKIFGVMASAKPLLYSGSGEGARVVEAAQAGLVTPPQDAAALAEAAETLLADPALCQRLGEQGRAYVQKNLQWPEIIDRWIKELLAKHVQSK